MGGYNGVSYLSIIDRIDFPFNSGTASNVGNLSISNYLVSGCNSSNYGYCMGRNSSINRVLFPFDSGTSTNVGNLSYTSMMPVGIDSTDLGY